MNVDLKLIKGSTRLALPDDDGYLFRIGVALYSFNSINSFLIEIITHLDPAASSIKLHELTSGKVLIQFREAVKKWTGVSISEPAIRVDKEFERLNVERTDFVHSYPITNGAHLQILHRRIEKLNKYFEVTSDFLDDFIRSTSEISDALYEIRSIAKPDL